MEALTIEIIANIVTIFSSIIAIITIIIAYLEYQRIKKQSIFDTFFKLHDKFLDNNDFNTICDYLEFEAENPDFDGFKEISPYKRYKFLSFFEELELILQKNVMDQKIVFDFFGYYIIKCYESNKFWECINRKSIYWNNITHFYKIMKSMEKDYINYDSSFTNRSMDIFHTYDIAEEQQHF